MNTRLEDSPCNAICTASEVSRLDRKSMPNILFEESLPAFGDDVTDSVRDNQ